MSVGKRIKPPVITGGDCETTHSNPQRTAIITVPWGAFTDLDIRSLRVHELQEHLAQLVGVGEVPRGRDGGAGAAGGAAAARVGRRAAPARHLLRALPHTTHTTPILLCHGNSCYC